MTATATGTQPTVDTAQLPRPEERCELQDAHGNWVGGYRAVSTIMVSDPEGPCNGNPCIRVATEEQWRQAMDGAPNSTDGDWPMPEGVEWPLHALRRLPDAAADDSYAPTDPDMLALISNPDDLPRIGEAIAIEVDPGDGEDPRWQNGLRCLSGPVRSKDGPAVWICWEVAWRGARENGYRPPAQRWPIAHVRRAD